MKKLLLSAMLTIISIGLLSCCLEEQIHENLTIRNVSNDTLMIALNHNDDHTTNPISGVILGGYGAIVVLPHTEGTIYGYRELKRDDVYIEVFKYQLYRDKSSGNELKEKYDDYNLSSNWFSVDELNRKSRILTYPFDFGSSYEDN